MWNMVKLCYGYKKDIVDDIVNIIVCWVFFSLKFCSYMIYFLIEKVVCFLYKFVNNILLNFIFIFWVFCFFNKFDYLLFLLMMYKYIFLLFYL